MYSLSLGKLLPNNTKGSISHGFREPQQIRHSVECVAPLDPANTAAGSPVLHSSQSETEDTGFPCTHLVQL